MSQALPLNSNAPQPWIEQQSTVQTRDAVSFDLLVRTGRARRRCAHDHQRHRRLPRPSDPACRCRHGRASGHGCSGDSIHPVAGQRGLVAGDAGASPQRQQPGGARPEIAEGGRSALDTRH